MRRVRHGSDEPGDDLEFVLGEPIQDGVRAFTERAEEGQPGGLALVGVAQVDDPVVGRVIAGAADVAGLLEAVDDQTGAAGGQAELLAQLPAETLLAGAGALVVLAVVSGSPVAVTPLLIATVAIPSAFVFIYALTYVITVSTLVKNIVALAGVPVTDVKILSTGLAAGIIDATIIRGVLAPALVALLGRANWWLPRPAARLLRATPLTARQTQASPAPPGGVRPASRR